MLIRAKMAGLDSGSFLSTLFFLPRMSLVAYYDLLYVAGTAVLFLLLLFPVRNNRTIHQVLSNMYSALAVFSLIAALANVKLVQLLGGPLTYEWLYYSDFMRSPDLRNVLWSTESRMVMGFMTLLSFALLLFSHWARKAIDYINPKRLRLMILIYVAVYFPFATLWAKTRYRETQNLQNPIISFCQSMARAWWSPGLFTLKTSLVFDDLEDSNSVLTPLPIQRQDRRGVQNLILVVLESVPAEYIDGYGSAYPITPELDKYRQRSALFRNIYAHTPSTNESLVSMLLSIYPWISYQGITREHPDIVFPSLSSELKKHGYRTAFFSAADLRFQRADVFLAHRQFDNIEDYRNLSCNGYARDDSTPIWHYMGSTDDECLVAPVIEFASKSRPAPFFAMIWTNNTHYPYYISGEELNFGVKDASLNRYLNALHHGDKVIGKLLRDLESRDLLDSTLVVVVGDHGEAFGRHQQISHATKIYEENVHVPLILINQALFSGQEHSMIGGLVDLAPTIMHALNHPSPPQWQGRSLFSDHKRNRTYFFASRSVFLFGYREANRKHIVDATLNGLNNEREKAEGVKERTDEIYDLNDDPTETTNLAARFPDAVSQGQERLSAWVQYSNSFMKSLLMH
jgi:arylsulfatase A-like enzyme